ncbi:MAG: PilT/PilU family type 4a pilus ATPase [Phycisphaerales bacterium]|nr:PilT/PilU family type 4a pilus ATPase [Phycisphaerales bacterium]
MTEQNVSSVEATQQAQAVGGAEAKLPRINIFFKTVAALAASDLHVKSDAVPRVRIGGMLKTLKMEPLSGEEVDAMAFEMMNEEQRQKFHDNGTLDLAYAMNKTERFRVNVFRQRGTTSIVARRINPKIPNYQELRLPEVLGKIADREQGMILLCGITGSGKSTTIAAMIEQINQTKSVHVVTIEDPIEYTYVDKKAHINQREIGLDVIDFESGIRSMLREDPDVLLIGEMRDRLTFQAAMQAAETGHLVFSTIHASSASGAITRILELFPKDQHSNIRQVLAANIVAIIYQKLVPALDPKIKRVPAVEVMLNSPSVRKYILEERESELTSVIRNERGTGMIDFNDMLADLVTGEIISSKEALASSPNADELRMRMKGIKTF